MSNCLAFEQLFFGFLLGKVMNLLEGYLGLIGSKDSVVHMHFIGCLGKSIPNNSWLF
jgi:hypothetical protein